MSEVSDFRGWSEAGDTTREGLGRVKVSENSEHLASEAAREALARAEAVREPGRWEVDPDDPHSVRLWRVLVGSYQEPMPLVICKSVPTDIANFVGNMTPEKVIALARALLADIEERERLSGQLERLFSAANDVLNMEDDRGNVGTTTERLRSVLSEIVWDTQRSHSSAKGSEGEE